MTSSRPATLAADADAPRADRSARQVARRSGSSFLMSFALAGPERRRGLVAVYAFCRVVDDAVDEPATASERAAELELWSDELERVDRGEPRTGIGQELQHAMRRFGIEKRHLRSVIDGVRSDLTGAGFETFAELESYCFKVASSVGLACLPVFGARGPDAERYALHLGQALQLTNILRDLRGDAQIGRIYVPRALLSELGIEPEWLRGEAAPEVYSLVGPMAALTGVLSARAFAHFERAAECANADLRRLLLPAEVMGGVYRDLLRRLERLGGEVCRARRVRVPRWRKVMIVLATRARVRGAR